MVNRRVRATSKKRGSSRYFVLVLLALTVILLLYLGAQKLLNKWEVFKIEKIEIVGFDNLEEDFLMNQCIDLIGENLFSVSIDEIENRFSNIIRVKKVRFSKRLPDKLKIYIQERKAFIQVRSKEGNLFPVDIERVVLDSDKFYPADVCPIIHTGIANSIFLPGEILNDSLLVRAHNLVKEIVNYKADFIYSISEIYEKDGDLILIDCNRGYKIYLGVDNIYDKLERLEFVATNREIEAGYIVDLRFNGKLILRAEDR